jgi:hypothetical protein
MYLITNITQKSVFLSSLNMQAAYETYSIITRQAIFYIITRV